MALGTAAPLLQLMTEANKTHLWRIWPTVNCSAVSSLVVPASCGHRNLQPCLLTHHWVPSRFPTVQD